MDERYETIRALQQAVQPSPSSVMGSVSGAPILPSLRDTPATPQTQPAQ